MELRKARKIFLDSKKTEGVTARTYQTYRDTLKPFLLYLTDEGIFDLEDVEVIHIRGYLVKHKEMGVRNVTLHRDYRVMKTFFLFMYSEGVLQRNLFEKIKPPKIEKKLARTFTTKEIKTILNSFDKSSFTGLRNYTMTELMFSTGIRKAEMADARINDLNITGELLKIRGKGNKERFIPIGKVMQKTFSKYLKQRKEYLEERGMESEFLFVSIRGTRISVDGIGTIFQKVRERLGLQGERTGCHTWRHTFAKNYLLNGGDIFSLQKIMGHESLETTKLYLSLLTDDVKSQHARYNPLDNMDWLV